MVSLLFALLFFLLNQRWWWWYHLLLLLDLKGLFWLYKTFFKLFVVQDRIINDTYQVLDLESFIYHAVVGFLVG